ncbi:MAG: S24 family peptidase [Tissierellia bacterium]|nr:S24 family peptidase [Tissierellia bacterium]
MEFKNRLKDLRESEGLNKKELSEALKFSPSIISMYEAGNRKPSIENLEIIADFFNVDVDYLLGKTTYTMRSAQKISDPNVLLFEKTDKKIPLVRMIAAEAPFLADENIVGYIDISEKIQADFALRIVGDTMINANIFDGDIVFVRQQHEVEDGEIAAVLIDGKATLKRVYKIGGVVQLRAENPRYSPMTLENMNDVLILGKATFKLSRVL